MLVHENICLVSDRGSIMATTNTKPKTIQVIIMNAKLVSVYNWVHSLQTYN